MYKNLFSDNAKDGVTFLTSENIRARHAFTTRLGGASEGHLASLNLGENRGDTPENVLENYRRLSAATGIDTDRMVYTNQIHEATILTARRENAQGHFEPTPYKCDGIVTSESALTISCFTADCVPVLLCDERAGVIGAAHCGWRGSVSDILKNAVSAMCALGAAPEDINVAIGPAIGFCCFEVGAEVVRVCEAYIGAAACAKLVQAKGGGKFRLDLKAANAERLLQLGLLAEHISISPDCTMCSHEKYFSHRHTEGQRGSQGAFITL